ncbi:hypothetical protein [Streptococcus salivarius]|uniref:hypothetical protein n=1 Tax=Streptococcus salivarius TaxID=1304 RepID=UPI00319DE72D
MKKKNCLFTFAVILLSIALTGCSVSKNLINTAKNVSGRVTSKSSSSSTTSSSSESVSSSNFNPQDTSDATIESISTYNDYLTMYSKIVDEYLTNYLFLAQYLMTQIQLSK